ncbi:hypothetical protein AKJ09_04437 [Labilithrix luteola]|uniref:Uncharacterized protein n=1 Tax=Labilithrix luteola TaxID=1391654 RepID=A0A0K1PW79_9BACT|nr:hypothetical protein AKJ09_04437 [Labilithrix luteola]
MWNTEGRETAGNSSTELSCRAGDGDSRSYVIHAYACVGTAQLSRAD